MKPDKTSPLLGAHFSIAKGLHHALYEAETYGCTALQIFTKNTSAWKERTLTQEELTGLITPENRQASPQLRHTLLI